MTLPPGFLDELRGRLSLAQVVGRKVAWDPRKSNPGRGDFWAPCPFHQERTASFHVDEVKGYYYCFGCHAKGDAISFLRESENMGFMEAVEALARDAGMTLPERSLEARETEGRHGRLHAAMEAAVAFYRLCLNAAKGAEARAYLDRRGIAPATRETFEIGFAPDASRALAEHLAIRGFNAAEAAEAGLTAVPDDGRAPYDRFRGRIVFPIRDARGRAIAFGGRALDPGARAKYLNSPETPLFDKGRTLFNLGPARAAAGRSGRLVVVEGYMDAIALAQAGIPEAVAPLGTAITEDQLDALWRIAPEPLIALDGDRAGLDAAQRLIDIALPRLVAGRSLRFALMPAGQDPDDVVRSGGRTAFEALVEASQPIVELLWRRETEGQALDSPERRAALDARLKAHLAKIRDDSLRAHTSSALRERRSALFAAGKPRREARAFAPSPSGGRPNGFGRSRERRWLPVGPTEAAKASLLGRAGAGLPVEERLRESAILLGLINHPKLLPAFEERLERMVFLCPDLAQLRDALLACLVEAPAGSAAPPAGELAGRLAVRLGRDPHGPLQALGQLRANPHLGAEADSTNAARAIDAEMVRHAVWMDMESETRDAEQALAGDPDEGLTWRLRQAADAHHRADREALAEDDGSQAAASDLSRRLQELIDGQIWKKPRRR